MIKQMIGVAALLIALYVGNLISNINDDYEDMKSHYVLGVELGVNEEVGLNPYGAAQSILDEVAAIWKQPDGDSWKLEFNTTLLKVASKPVLGPLHRFGVPVQRARLSVKCRYDPDAVFQFMTSRTGLALIDPTLSNSTLTMPALTSFEWFRGRLELVYSYVVLPWPFHNREYTTFDVVDEAQRVLVSKSVPLSAVDRHAIPPRFREGSLFAKPPPPVITATKLFALKLQHVKTTQKPQPEEPAAPGDKNTGGHGEKEYHYIFHMIAFTADVVPSAMVTYYLNSKLYFPMISRSILKALE